MKLHPYRALWLVAALAFAFALSGCDGDSTEDPTDDPHVQEGGDLPNDREVLSPLILSHPIYQCASAISVQGFVPDARIDIFVQGNPTPVGSTVSSATWGVEISVTPDFVAGQVVTAVQTFDGTTSGPSNAVTVTSHLEDYPDGLPKPRVSPELVHECGRAVGFRDVVPGGWVKLFGEKPAGGGGFDPPALIRETASSASGNSYFTFGTGLDLGERVHFESGLCSDLSEPSDPQIAQPEPSLTKPTVDGPVYEGQDVVVVRDYANGALLEVFHNVVTPVGGQAAPGGAGQQVGISPDAGSTGTYEASQALCSTSPHSDPVPAKPCSELPPAKIKEPLPGDTIIEVTEYVPGSRIRIYGGAQEIGDGGGPLVALTRPVMDGETITVVQELGGCVSVWVYVVDVDCEELLGGDALACSADWPAFQHGIVRNAQQTHAGTLGDPYRVLSLPENWGDLPTSRRWEFPTSGSVGGFRAGPMVFDGRVYVGSGDGYLYALDAATGVMDWQYPAADDDALISDFTCNPSSWGIASSAAYARIRNEEDAVIFGAPDRSIGAGDGSGRLFALNAQTGNLIWQSDEIAQLDMSPGGRHEQIGYSSPLVVGDRIYIGIANHCDNPIQNGQVIAVDLTSGNIIGSFSFVATSSRGGGVWSSVGAGFGEAVYVTTGNTNDGQTEPAVNHGLSFLRLNAGTGAIEWDLQPVPFDEDGDPDWASGTTSVAASCGDLIVSTMKDGWTYAVRATPPLQVRWQFPNTGWPFPVGTTTVHGDTRYHRAGAAWEDVFFTTAGGTDVLDKSDQFDVIGGYTRLHALNICSSDENRVRWLLDLPGAATSAEVSKNSTYVSPPSVAGGIVYIGTHRNHLVAIADTSVWPSTTYSCEHSGFLTDADCTGAGFALVPKPKVLADMTFPGGGGILNEAALAGGRIFVATTGGKVFMVQP